MTYSTALPVPDSRGGDTLMVCWKDRHVWTREAGIIPTGTPCDCGVKMWRVGGCSRCNEKDGEIQRLRAALERISKCEDAPDIDATGEWQTGLYCGVEDRDCQDRYQGADYGHAVGVEKGLEWASNEAKRALDRNATRHIATDALAGKKGEEQP